MSDLAIPRTSLYPIGEQSRGAMAEFDSEFREYLKAEQHDAGSGFRAYWTTDMRAVDLSGVITNILPDSTEVEVWHWSKSDIFNLGDSDAIAEAVSDGEVIRMTFDVKPGIIASGGLFIAWRIIQDSYVPPFQIGTLEESSDLPIARQLIQETATESIKPHIDLLDQLVAKIKSSESE